MPVKKIDASKSRDEAFALYEEVSEYFLSHALDGDVFTDAMNEAKAAFDVMDTKTLRMLCDDYQTRVDFIEADEALKKHLKRMKPIKLQGGGTRKFTMADYTQAQRERILSEFPGTRAYARAVIENQGGGTPFDD